MKVQMNHNLCNLLSLEISSPSSQYDNALFSSEYVEMVCITDERKYVYKCAITRPQRGLTRKSTSMSPPLLSLVLN